MLALRLTAEASHRATGELRMSWIVHLGSRPASIVRERAHLTTRIVFANACPSKAPLAGSRRCRARRFRNGRPDIRIRAAQKTTRNLPATAAVDIENT